MQNLSTEHHYTDFSHAQKLHIVTPKGPNELLLFFILKINDNHRLSILYLGCIAEPITKPEQFKEFSKASPYLFLFQICQARL